MSRQRVIWVHPASYTFRLDEPERILETIWGERPGWGYLRRRDMWVQKECTVEELQSQGYVIRVPVSEDGAQTCPHCRMYICDVPGFLVRKHLTECGGTGDDWYKMEEGAVNDQRLRVHQARLMAEQLRIQKEMEEAERKERFERIREENVARQHGRDRKARLKRETQEELRRR